MDWSNLMNKTSKSKVEEVLAFLKTKKEEDVKGTVS